MAAQGHWSSLHPMTGGSWCTQAPPLLPLGGGALRHVSYAASQRFLSGLPPGPHGVTRLLTSISLTASSAFLPAFSGAHLPHQRLALESSSQGLFVAEGKPRERGQTLCIRCRAGLTPGSHDPPKPIVGSPTWVCHLTVLRTSYWAQPQGRLKALCTLQWAEEGEGHQVKPPQSQQVLGTGAPKSLSGALGDQGWPTAQGVRPSHPVLVQTPRVSGFAQPVSSAH